MLRNTIIGLLFATLFVPLFVAGNFPVTVDLFFPFIGAKVFAFRILVEIAAFLYTILALSHPEYRPKKTPILVALSAFIVVIAAADLFGVNPARSFWSNFERMEGLVTHLHLYVYAVMLMSVFRSKNWYAFFHTSLGTSFIVALYGVVQLSGKLQINQGGVRLDATFGNATYLAVYLLFHIFFALFYAVRSRNLGAQITYGALIALQLVVLYYTATRGAILGLIVGLFLAACVYAVKGSGIGRKIAIGGITAIFALVAGFYLVRDSAFVRNSPVLARFASISATEATTESRFIIWGMSLKGFKENPILGWGQENYNIVFNKNFDPRLYRQEQWFDRAHNVFFDWLIAGGILGLASYLSIFVAAVWMLARSSRLTVAEKSVLFGLLAGYFFQNIFVFDNITSYIFFYAIAGYIAFASSPEENRPVASSASQPISGVAYDSLLAASGIVFLLTLFYVNIRPMQTSATLLNALRSFSEGKSDSLDYFKKALSYNTSGSVEAREQLAQLALQASEKKTFDEGTRKEFVELARTEMAKQANDVPLDARYALFEGIVLTHTGSLDEGIGYLERALELSPKKQTIIFELVNAYAAKRNYQKAFDYAKMAFELDPAFDEARNVYAVSALYLGNEKLSEEILAGNPAGVSIPDSRFIQAYIDLKRYDKIIEIWKAHIKADPNNAQYHVSLAATYLTTGQRSLAVEEIRTAIRLNPSFKDQGEFYIKEIQAGRNP